jgi:primosomal protein N'
VKCERCGSQIMKAFNFCPDCGAPNPRNEHAEERLKKAVLGAVALMGVDVERREGASGRAAWEEFERLMWPRVEV